MAYLKRTITYWDPYLLTLGPGLISELQPLRKGDSIRRYAVVLRCKRANDVPGNRSKLPGNYYSNDLMWKMVLLRISPR